MTSHWLSLLPRLCALKDQLPDEWRTQTPDGFLRMLRQRLQFTQDELARKAGMPQVQVSRLESAADARLSTWRRVFDAMGCDLVVLPIPRLTPQETERAAQEGRPPDWRRRERFKRRGRRTPTTRGW
jgi:transcriptional regulator with XRE-family HTH domain